MSIALTAFQRHQRDLLTKKYARDGLSATKALGRLKDAGLGQRKTDFLKVYRSYKGLPAKENVIKSVRKDRGISRKLYTENHGFMLRRYRYDVLTRFRDIVTGETKDYYTAVIKDTELMPWQIEQEAGNAIDVMLRYGNLALQDRYVTGAYHREGDIWQ